MPPLIALTLLLQVACPTAIFFSGNFLKELDFQSGDQPLLILQESGVPLLGLEILGISFLGSCREMLTLGTPESSTLLLLHLLLLLPFLSHLFSLFSFLTPHPPPVSVFLHK